MENKKWLMCPVCNGKTRTMIYEETTLRYFPLYCPKCKLERIINVEQGKIVKIRSNRSNNGQIIDRGDRGLEKRIIKQ